MTLVINTKNVHLSQSDLASLKSLQDQIAWFLAERKLLIEALARFEPFQFDDFCIGCGLEGTDYCRIDNSKEHAPNCIWVAARKEVKQ